MKNKVYLGNLDGSREGLVISTSQKKAAQIAGTTLYDFRLFWTTLRNYNTIGLKENTLYTKKFDSKENWTEGKCDLKK